jgi:hypothetical protein
LWVTLSIIGAIVVIAIISAAAGGSKSGGSPAAGAASAAASPSPHPSAAATHAARQTVTYEVYGSGANVTYGPAGSSLNGHVPMEVTRTLGNPQYYSITAQLNGGGAVTCKLRVDGKVISKSSATGGYNIASCEIDDMGGSWENTNG